MKINNVKIVFPVTSVLALLAGYLVISSGFYAISADESTRTLIAWYWFKSGIIEHNSWLPLHFIIVGLGFNLLPDLIILPRVISLFSGILTIAAAGYISSLLFKNKAITFTTIMLTAFLPQRFILSLLPLPEITYIFFICLGAYFLYKWIHLKNYNSLLISSGFWSIAALFRYESWLFLICLTAFIIYEYYNKHIKLHQLILIMIINGLFPLGWILYSYGNSGVWLSFLNEPADVFASKYNNESILKFNPLYLFVEQNLFSLNLIGIAGIYLLRKNRQIMKWLVLLFSPLLFLSLLSLFGSSLPAHNFWRISAVWSVLLIPLTAYSIIQIKDRWILPNHVMMQKVLLIILLVQFTYNSYYIIETTPEKYTLSRANIKTGESLIDYLNKKGDKESRVLIESIPSYEHFHVVLASGDPFKFIYSEKHRLLPIKREKYMNTQIDYFLVKSYANKRMLKRDRHMQEVLEFNNWTLFQRYNN